MKPLTFFYVIAALCAVLLLYYGIVMLSKVPTAPQYADILKKVLVLVTVIGEVRSSKTCLRITVLIAALGAAIGILFIIQFWPFGHLLFGSSMAFLFAGLLIRAFSSPQKISHALLLVFPIIYTIHFGVLRWPGHWLFDLAGILLTLIVAIVLIVQEKRHSHAVV